VVEGRQALSDRREWCQRERSSLPVRWRLSVLRLPPCSQHSIKDHWHSGGRGRGRTQVRRLRRSVVSG